MLFFQARTPEDYQQFFYTQTGLNYIPNTKENSVWENPEVGFIHNYGSLNSIQAGIGNYTIPSDFAINYKYDRTYLHFGIVYKGITHSIIDNNHKIKYTPSAFFCIDKLPHGTNYWKCGQHFKGTELSIDMQYLHSVLLPVLGEEKNILDFLQDNVRYMLSDEMKIIMLRIESLLTRKKMTTALVIAIALELVALLIHPDNQKELQLYDNSFSEYVSLGSRKILFTKEDFRKVIQAHEMLENNANNFPTVYSLSRELQISEQKLKSGFYHLYQQTIWDFANNIRMNTAIEMLKDTEDSIASISQAVGYQSQAAFNNMFKKWTGITPRSFRAQISKNYTSPL